MNSNLNPRAKAPWHLWLIGIATLLFNAMGVFSYTMTKLGKLADLGMTPEQIAEAQALARRCMASNYQDCG